MAPTPPVVLARFTHREDVDRASEALRQAGVDVHGVRVDDATDRRALEDARMERETDRAVPAIAVGVMTQSQAVGSFRDALLWGVIGAVVVQPFAFLTFTSWELWTRMALYAVCGFLAGATAGFVYGGGHEPVARDEVIDQGTTDEAPAVTLAVPVADRTEADRVAAILHDVDAEADVAVRDVSGPAGERSSQLTDAADTADAAEHLEDPHPGHDPT